MAELGKKRNFVLAGHGSAGKTSLAEALLFKAKVTSRLGKVSDKTSHLDHDDDERDRQSSIRAGIGFLQHQGHDITLVDTPGYPDFIAEVYSCIPAVETVCITISATDGIGVNTRRCWELAERYDKGRVILVTKIDGEHTTLEGTISKIRQTFGERCIPVNLPNGWGPGVKSGVSVFHAESASGPLRELADRYRMEAVEAAVEADDAMMEKYLEAGDVSDEEVKAIMPKAVALRTFTPIFFTSLGADVGFDQLLDAIIECFPSPAHAHALPHATKDGNPFEVKPDHAFTAQVFRVQHATVGKQAFLRVWSGKTESGANLFNAQTGKAQKIGEFMRVTGHQTTPAGAVSAGDIVMLAKVEHLGYGDTLTAGEKIQFERVHYPKPMVVRAITPKSRNDETKLGEALSKLTESDPTFVAGHDFDTKELVARGITELHLDLVLRSLKDRYKVEVETKLPRIPYRETITAPVEAHHRHKKQTGGAGQFGEVYIRVKPTSRGTGFQFVDDVVGGVIPNVFIPAVEKGIREKMTEGIVAGYPVVDLEVSLYDGKHHPVDSKEIAFKTAGREAIKKAVRGAKPKLLEPIVNLSVVAPSKYMGDITGDLNGRRGRVVGMDSEGADLQVIKAQIPLAEVQTYPAVLRSMTAGEGSYSIEFSHYDVVPNEIAEGIIAKFEDKDKDEE